MDTSKQTLQSYRSYSQMSCRANGTLSQNKDQRRRLKLKIFLWTAVGLSIWLFGLSYFTPQLAGKSWLGRKLLTSSECSSHAQWIENGGVVLYFVGVLYLFLGIAIVCDDFFVGSLEAISAKLGLSEDVAGATFMAAGSSAPELFSSLVALTNDEAANDIGVGTIVGSAIFNILVIIGVTSLFSGQTLHLDYRPLIRDAVFYAAAITGVIGIFHDGKVYWWEGLISVLLYGAYIVTMKYNSQIMDYLPAPPNKSNRVTSGVCGANTMTNGSSSARETHPDGDIESNNKDGEKDQESKDKYNVLAKSESGAESSREIAEYAAPNLEPLYKNDSNDKDQQTFCDITMQLLSLPWYIAFKFTVPDCQKEGWENWYFLTFTNSIAWIGLISWFMVEWASDIGCVLGIPSAIMGVTVLAAGTSIPDALSSIIVAKQGMGDMAVANAVGSNVFDIWLGLGLPWLMVVPFKEDGNDGRGKYIDVDNDELLPNVLILFGVLMFYLASVILAKWKLYRKEGYLFLGLYGIYALYNVVGVWILDIYNQED